MRVFIIAALSADGFIGQHAQHLALDWTSKEDKKLFVEKTKEAGVVVMGSRTFATFKRAFSDRRLIIYTSKPESIDVDGVETTSETPKDLVERLEKEGATTLAVGGGATIYKMFMESGLVDELFLTIEPVIFGEGVPLFGGPVLSELTLVEEKRLNKNTILLHYSVDK
jgi:dihydrofolate reductase